jgi:hypothetical protein
VTVGLSNFRDIIFRLEQQKVAIDRAIAALRDFDEGARAVPVPPKPVKRVTKKRVLSDAGRQAIADAARRRWAALRKSGTRAA